MQIIEFTYQTDNLRLLRYYPETRDWDCNFKNPASGRWVANKKGHRYKAIFHDDGTVSLRPSVNILPPAQAWHGYYRRGEYVV